MAKVISLRTVRRQKAREQERARRDSCGADSWATSNEVQLQTRLAKALDQHLDRHKREPE